MKPVDVSEKDQMIGRWKSRVFELSDLKYITLHRTDSIKTDKSVPRQPRDEPPAIDYQEYFYGDVPEGKGMGLIYASERFRKKKRNFKGKVWLTTEFPLTLEKLSPLLEMLSPTAKHFSKLQTFLSMRTPVGHFPIQIEMPVFPTVMATVTFTLFEERHRTDDRLFSIPPDYEKVNLHLMDFFLGEEE